MRADRPEEINLSVEDRDLVDTIMGDLQKVEAAIGRARLEYTAREQTLMQQSVELHARLEIMLSVVGSHVGANGKHVYDVDKGMFVPRG